MEHTFDELTASAPVSPDGALPMPGATLAAARIAKGMTVEDVARLLKLSVAQVRAIEADDHSKLPSLVFVRGFIRSYARIVSVDIVPLLPPQAAVAENRDTHLMHHAPGVSFERNRRRPLPLIAAGVTFVLLGLAYYEFVLNAPPAAVQVASTVPTPQMPSVAPGDDPPDSPAPALSTSVATAEVPGPPVPEENLKLKKSIDPSSGANEKGLHFLFNGESWVEVRDGEGKVVFSKTNAAGSERIVRGDPPFSVVVGGASGVQLSYNGSRVDLASYATEDVARLRLE
ncbi:MAG TPA: RodZ domain-containing protein [Burkholderiales bacterium]|nr:RodZ domain-containing protein [Burkholderiales bacterium]